MLNLIRQYIGPQRRKLRAERKAFQSWGTRDYSENAPQFVKERMFLKHGIPGAQWVETGTYLGTTTAFLARHYPCVHSIEPGNDLYKTALERFQGSNAKIYHGTSENVMPGLLADLSGDINFWLDGHFSDGITYRGERDCPVIEELRAISENLGHFGSVSVLIDDIRCFLTENREQFHYPDIGVLVGWAMDHEFHWRVENDILIMKRLR